MVVAPAYRIAMHDSPRPYGGNLYSVLTDHGDFVHNVWRGAKAEDVAEALVIAFREAQEHEASRRRAATTGLVPIVEPRWIAEELT